MAARVVPSANTILEVLNLYNYEDWSTRVKTYLIAEGLWDIVVEAKVETPRENLVEDTAETPTTETEKWTMKNAKALHAIQNSCRADVFGFIRDIETAKNAWETLAKRLKPKNTDIEGMAATLFPRVMINFKALNQDNFEHWSFWVKTYLLNEDLWDVVKGTSEPPKQKNGEGEEESMAWRKNNARALHVITIFCGEDAKSSISGIERAKDAWNTLAEKFEPPEILVTPEPEKLKITHKLNNVEGRLVGLESFDTDLEAMAEGSLARLAVFQRKRERVSPAPPWRAIAHPISLE